MGQVWRLVGVERYWDFHRSDFHLVVHLDLIMSRVILLFGGVRLLDMDMDGLVLGMLL